jgi:nucleoside-diphosphate-sugar epimerase
MSGRSTARPVRRVLVVGGAGYVGSVLVRDLLEAGYGVTVLDAFMYGEDALQSLFGRRRIRVVRGDIRDVESVVRAMRDADAVIHLGALVGDPVCALDEEATLDINLHATRTLAWVARGLGVQRFVFASSCSIYGAGEGVLDESSPLAPVPVYARSKAESERLLLDMADETFAPCVLRFATLYGLSPRPRFDLVVNLLTAKAVTDREMSVFGGSQWRPFLHVADAAGAAAHCLTADIDVIRGAVFNVGSDDDNYTLAQMAQVIATQVPGSRVVLQSAAEVEADYHVSFARMRDVLGYTPQRRLPEGVAEIRDAVALGAVGSYADPQYSNVQSLSAKPDVVAQRPGPRLVAQR